MTDNQDTMISHNVASLLSSRLCHELIGPVGALMGGFDMLAEFGDDFTPEEHGMLRQSADRLSLRAQFYRLAYGTAGYRLIAPQEVMPLLCTMLAEQNIRFNPPDDAIFANAPQGGLWLVMNLVFLGADILTDDGQVAVIIPDGDFTRLQVEFTGNQTSIDGEFGLALKNELPEEKLTAYNVHGVHNAMVARRLGYKIMCDCIPQQKAVLTLLQL